MSLPYEKINSLINTRHFLKMLIDKDTKARLTKEDKLRAKNLLSKFFTPDDLTGTIKLGISEDLDKKIEVAIETHSFLRSLWRIYPKDLRRYLSSCTRHYPFELDFERGISRKDYL